MQCWRCYGGRAILVERKGCLTPCERSMLKLGRFLIKHGALSYDRAVRHESLCSNVFGARLFHRGILPSAMDNVMRRELFSLVVWVTDSAGTIDGET